VKAAETALDEMQDARQAVQEAFAAYDQKANQLWNIMVGMLRVMNEQRADTPDLGM
jgi:hypothetical protein